MVTGDTSVLEYMPGSRRTGQSQWGLASLFSGIIAAVLFAALLVIINVWGKPGAPVTPASYKLFMLVGFIVPLHLSVLVGLITGLVGSLQKRRLRKWAFAGLGLNVALFLMLAITS